MRLFNTNAQASRSRKQNPQKQPDPPAYPRSGPTKEASSPTPPRTTTQTLTPASAPTSKKASSITEETDSDPEKEVTFSARRCECVGVANNLNMNHLGY